jgi:serine/threonine protein phosphatase PrpC
MANGAMAAYHICEVTAKRCKRPSGSVDVVPDWAWWLSQLDQEMASEPSLGQAAVVIVEILNDGLVTGASVGDCEAKVFATDSELLNLTEDQHRKPLLGDGRAVPTGFEARVKNGVLVVATDGLWKYRDSTKIVQEVATRPLELVGDSLVRGIWLENGCQPDDVALAIVEICEPWSPAI